MKTRISIPLIMLLAVCMYACKKSEAVLPQMPAQQITSVTFTSSQVSHMLNVMILAHASATRVYFVGDSMVINAVDEHRKDIKFPKIAVDNEGVGPCPPMCDIE